jgi:hypothetical protein
MQLQKDLSLLENYKQVAHIMSHAPGNFALEYLFVFVKILLDSQFFQMKMNGLY